MAVATQILSSVIIVAGIALISMRFTGCSGSGVGGFSGACPGGLSNIIYYINVTVILVIVTIIGKIISKNTNPLIWGLLTMPLIIVFLYSSVMANQVLFQYEGIGGQTLTTYTLFSYQLVYALGFIPSMFLLFRGNKKTSAN